jgi:hypothetical protein
MSLLLRTGAWLKKAFLVGIAGLCFAVLIWGIVYKILMPFAPAWLDEIAICAVPISLVVAWVIGRSAAVPDAEPSPNQGAAKATRESSVNAAPTALRPSGLPLPDVLSRKRGH